MNAHELLRKWISEALTEYNKAKDERNFWKAHGLKQLYNMLKELQDRLH